MSIKLVRKLKRNINDFGFAMALRKVYQYLFKPFYENRTYRIYCINLDDWVEADKKETNFEFKFIRPSDVKTIEEIEYMEEWLAGTVKVKLQNNFLCLAALDGDRVAGFNIIALNKINIPLIGKSRELKNDEAWSEQITVSKEYRLLGLATELRRRVFIELKKRNIKKVYGGTLPSNIGSLRLARSVGFREIEDVHFLKILWHKKWKSYEVVN